MPLGRLRRNEPADFFRQARVLDVINAQAGVEIGEIDQVGLLFHIRRCAAGYWCCAGRSGRPCRRNLCTARPAAAPAVGNMEMSFGLVGSLMSTMADEIRAALCRPRRQLECRLRRFPPNARRQNRLARDRHARHAPECLCRTAGSKRELADQFRIRDVADIENHDPGL